MNGSRLACLGWVALALCTLLAGCRADLQPRKRLGCLPCPGLFTGYELADPERLGVHHYDEGLFIDHEVDEVERGLLYTCRGGFLDLAHVRETVDWSWYMAGSIKPALRNGVGSVVIEGRELTRYHVTFDYPDGWADMDPAERRVAVDELSRRIGQQLSYLLVTWHEIITWYGYKSTGIWPEDQSAFTYEDMMSHVVGLRVADRAMRHLDRSWDEAVTEALDEILHELGVVSQDEAWEATMLVEDEWWSSADQVHRYLDIGLGGSIRPWLVPGLERCSDVEGESFALPDLADVNGRDLRDIYDVRIESDIYEWNRIRDQLDPRPVLVHPRMHFGILLEHIEAEMAAAGLNAVRQDRAGAEPGD